LIDIRLSVVLFRGKGGKVTNALTLPSKYGKFTKMKNGQGWKDTNGNMWKRDMKHKDHWDVSNPKTGKKVMEVDFNGKQIWTNGPKNKNK
jgi:hypothetical protein